MKIRAIKTIFNFLGRVKRLFCSNKHLTLILSDSSFAIESVRQFLDQVPLKDIAIIESEYKQLKIASSINKEKLFCINCFFLLNNRQLNDEIKVLLQSFYQGDYGIMLNETEAKEVFKMLKFTSKIFIQERNKSIKKLFVAKK